MVSLCAAVATVALGAPGQPVLLDFYADWCGPCRQMAPVVEQLAVQGYPVRKVNVDQHPELAARFRVTSVPCFVMVVDGREVGRITGRATPAKLAEMFHSAEPMGKSAASEVPEDTPLSADPLPGSDPGIPGLRVHWVTEPDSPGASGAPTREDLDQRLIAATVRLRVEDPHGRSCGTGTIIDARQGEALILTCAHLFRDSQGQGRIEVDLFVPQPVQAIPGTLIAYNLERDVALLSIRTPGPVVAARVAPREYRLAPGQGAISVGCNHGEAPTVVHSRITSIDRYLGPPNLQVAGQSVEGRSGGGIFSAEGLLVGVCNAAEPQDNESFCAALAAVHQQLDEAGLAFVYDESRAADATLLAADSSSPATAGNRAASPGPAAGAQSAPLAGTALEVAEGPAPDSGDPGANSIVPLPPAPEMADGRGTLVPVGPGGSVSPASADLAGQWSPEPGRWVSVGPAHSSNDALPSSGGPAAGSGSVSTGQSSGSADWGSVSGSPGLSSRPMTDPETAERALVEQIRRRLAEGAEVVCLIRAPNDASAAPQVIALRGASPALVEQLAAAVRQPRQLTSLEVLDRKTPTAVLHAEDPRLARVQPPRPRPVRPVWLPAPPPSGPAER